jgi:hypothetical protein
MRHGIFSFGLDLIDKDQEIGWEALDNLHSTPEGVKITRGDIAYLGGKDSVLRNHKFGFILFNGSWHASGNNFTVGGEMLEFKANQ